MVIIKLDKQHFRLVIDLVEKKLKANKLSIKQKEGTMYEYRHGPNNENMMLRQENEMLEKIRKTIEGPLIYAKGR